MFWDYSSEPSGRLKVSRHGGGGSAVAGWGGIPNAGLDAPFPGAGKVRVYD